MPSLSSTGGMSLQFLTQQDFHPTSSSRSSSTSLPITGRHESEGRSGRYSSSDDESSSSPSSSPERLPTLAPPIPSTSSLPNRVSSPKRTAGGMAVPEIRHDQVREEQEEEEDEQSEARESAFTPLPSSLPRPKTKADREREKALGLNTGAGKKDSMAKKMMRKRADSLKWAKYATTAAFEVELDLSNDDLRRN